MTTIACDRKSMVGDRKVTDGSLSYTTTKVFVIGDSIVGVAGVVSATNRWLAWYRSGCPTDGPSFSDDEEMNALVLNRRGIFLYAQCCDPDKLDDPFYAIGSGGMAALSLMKNCGWSPRDSVVGASKVDNHTGGKVNELFLSDVPFVEAKG